MREKTEILIWNNEILTWSDLYNSDFLFSFFKSRADLVRVYLEKAEESLKKNDFNFFLETLPVKEYWRLYGDFKDRCLFLDIETYGSSSLSSSIILIGTYNGKNIKIFMKDVNLEDILKEIENYDILVTFNGKAFDVPFLQKVFPNIRIPQVHFDLKYLLKSIGLTGGLKKIEKKLDLKRNTEVENLTGADVCMLWENYLKGNYDSLKKLILYNIYDTYNLKFLMDYYFLSLQASESLDLYNAIQEEFSFYKNF